MTNRFRPHVLGIDDGPFDKDSDLRVPIVGVMMEGPDLVEAVALTEFAVDGSDSAEFLADWISGLRCAEALQGVVLGGITIAGLAVIDVAELARRLALPVMVANRHHPRDDALVRALESAGFDDRVRLLERSPGAWQLSDGLHVTHAGASREEVARILTATLHKSQLPEPLRLAHLVGAALTRGQSRGRP